MGREECQQWAEAFDNEYQGFYKHKTLKMVRPEQGVKIFGTTTQTKYKVDNWVLKKRKVRLCVMGNQQTDGIHYQISELYAPVMEATKVQLFIVVAAKHSLNLFKSDSKQALLNGDMGDEEI